MSFQAMTWAVKQRVGNATGKAILLILANYADKDGYCMPGQKTLADECECSERTVREWLAKFEQIGLLKRDARRREDGYRTSDAIVLQIGTSPEAPAAETSPAAFSPENNSPENGADLTGSKFRAINRTSQVNRKSVGSERAPTQFDELSKVLDAVRAQAVIDHRKHFKGKFSPYAAKLLASKFAQTPDPNAAADEMIANGWQGFKPEWIQGRPARGSPPQIPKKPTLQSLVSDQARTMKGLGNGRSNPEDLGTQHPPGQLLRLAAR